MLLYVCNTEGGCVYVCVLYLSVCVSLGKHCSCSCTLLCALIDGCCPCRPTFLSGLESQHMSKHKMEDYGTLHYKE